MTAGEKIRQRRLEMGLTQSELENLTGIASQTISRFENRVRLPNNRCLKRMAEVFRCDVRDLEDDPETPYSATGRNRTRAGIIGAEIRKRRFEHGWTVTALATRAGISASSVKNYEGWYATPSDESLNKLARALGCTIKDLDASAPAPAPAPLPAPAPTPTDTNTNTDTDAVHPPVYTEIQFDDRTILYDDIIQKGIELAGSKKLKLYIKISERTVYYAGENGTAGSFGI